MSAISKLNESKEDGNIEKWNYSFEEYSQLTEAQGVKSKKKKEKVYGADAGGGQKASSKGNEIAWLKKKLKMQKRWI